MSSITRSRHLASSHSQSRNPPLLPPSLTLSRFPRPNEPNDVPVLSHLLSELLSLSLLLPLTLDFMNNRSFAPESKNEDLHSGMLQLPAGTVVLVTESGIQEGKVLEKGKSSLKNSLLGHSPVSGVRNVQALQEVMKFQTLHYNFPFSQFSFPTELNFIVLSEGKKSALCEVRTTSPHSNLPT